MLEAVDWFGDASLFVVDVALACCALESQAALATRPAVPLDDVPGQARVVVTISGTLTAPVMPAISQVLDARPDATVVAFGACALAGGPYWDAYSVLKGSGELAEVDHFVAGCPPPPGAFTQAIEAVQHA